MKLYLQFEAVIAKLIAFALPGKATQRGEKFCHIVAVLLLAVPAVLLVNYLETNAGIYSLKTVVYTVAATIVGAAMLIRIGTLVAPRATSWVREEILGL